MNFRIIIGLVLLSSFFSCQKPPESKTNGPNCIAQPVKYISAEISNFKFIPGTYWIFIDSATMVIDTMKVLIASGNIMPYEYCKDNYHEIYNFQVNAGDSYILEGDNMTRNQKYEDGSSYSIFVGNALKLDSMFIYDRYYKNVEGFLKNSDPAENGEKVLYYINTEFGFLRKDVFLGTSNFLKSQKLLKDKFIVR
jgi:hypothetical protein